MRKLAAVLALCLFAAPVLATPALPRAAHAAAVASVPYIGPSVFAAQTDEPAPAPLDWKEELVKLALGTALTALGIVATFALAKLREWADEKAKESKLAKALSALPHMAEAIWADIYSELKPEIEADAADGKISAEELETLKAHATDALKRALPKYGLGALKEAFGPLLDGVLAKVIDAASKKAGTEVSPPASP